MLRPIKLVRRRAIVSLAEYLKPKRRVALEVFRPKLAPPPGPRARVHRPALRPMKPDQRPARAPARTVRTCRVSNVPYQAT